VIDGRAREKCFERALKYLSDGGIIVFDNVERVRYLSVLDGLESTYEVQITQGLTPCLPYSSRTALIRKK